MTRLSLGPPEKYIPLADGGSIVATGVFKDVHLLLPGLKSTSVFPWSGAAIPLENSFAS